MSSKLLVPVLLLASLSMATAFTPQFLGSSAPRLLGSRAHQFSSGSSVCFQIRRIPALRMADEADPKDKDEKVQISAEELEQLANDAGVKIKFASSAAQPEVQKLMENPLIGTMTNELMKEDSGLSAIEDKLKSGQGIAEIMGSPEFQDLAKSVLQNPEIMKMMNDPAEMAKAYGNVMGQMKNMPIPKAYEDVADQIKNMPMPKKDTEDSE